MQYIRINRLTGLPDISQLAPFKAIIAIETPVSEQRQAEISAWLVNMGCRYVMSCGEGCNSWLDSVRKANLEVFNVDNLSVENFVMTTSHPVESLRSVFWFAKKSAKHPEVVFDKFVVIHLADRDRSTEYLGMYQKA